MTYKKLVMMLLAATALTACNESDEEKVTPEPSVVTTLDLTVASVTGSASWAPQGNVYIFYSEDCDLSYATIDGDGTRWPLMDASHDYSPVVKYADKDGQMQTLHPVSAYGTAAGGQLDNHSSVRYSQVHFDIASLATTYGTVKKGSTILVMVVLNDAQTKAWIARALTLRRDYLIHVSLPDKNDRTYVPETEQNSKWWQVDGEE